MNISITTSADARGPRLRGSAAEERLIKRRWRAYGYDGVMAPDMSGPDILLLKNVVADGRCAGAASLSVAAERSPTRLRPDARRCGLAVASVTGNGRGRTATKVYGTAGIPSKLTYRRKLKFHFANDRFSLLSFRDERPLQNARPSPLGRQNSVMNGRFREAKLH